MKKVSVSVLTIVLTLSSLSLIGQIKRSDLIGEWQTGNEDSLYYTSDSITFHMDANHRFDDKTCHVLNWRLQKSSFKLTNTYLCTEPGRLWYYNAKEKLLVKERDFGQVIHLKRKGKLIDQFKVIELKESKVERYPYDIKQLTVLRFDDPADQKLYHYVDSLVYKVLKFVPTPIDTIARKKILENAAATMSKIVIRDQVEINPKPLLVINGILFNNYEVLKQFLMVEVISIDYLSRTKAPMLCGSNASNGVIIIQLSDSRFRKFWKRKQ
ncbi:MAG: hypothetical protein AAFQ94_04860 [Bacteroidota bacterium]